MSLYTRMRKLKKHSTKIFALLVLFAICLVIYSNIRYDQLISKLSLLNFDQPFQPISSECLKVKEHNITRYLLRFPHMLDCKNEYNKWSSGEADPEPKYNYSKPADKKLHKFRITRAIIFFFPIDKSDYFKYEFLWVYRSWINMIRYEPSNWRTDIVFFTNYKPRKLKNQSQFFDDMNCTYNNRRQSDSDAPMCTLLKFEPINNRKFPTASSAFYRNEPRNYQHFFNNIDLFQTTTTAEGKKQLDDFYQFIQDSIKTYNYVDSILMAFDGYEYFKKAGYDFLIRSDMDVFLMPPFATWLPRFCNDFYVGRGGYSNTFNSKRFMRIASNLGLSYGATNNLGSTWYSTPDLFRLVSYLTLLSMAYVNNEEFAQPEREQKLGTLMWPEWHYGVLLLYGQHLALNHLIGSEQINVVRLENQFDYPSGNNHSIYNMLHVHVFHGENLFSKFMFKANRYENITLDEIDQEKSEMVGWYALKMALEGQRLPSQQLLNLFADSIKKKT